MYCTYIFLHIHIFAYLLANNHDGIYIYIQYGSIWGFFHGYKYDYGIISKKLGYNRITVVAIYPLLT